MIRAKFTVNSITRSLHWQKDKGEIHNVKMQPVSGGSEEDKSFFASTPSGEISLSTIHPGMFELGKSYYVDFTKTP